MKRVLMVVLCAVVALVLCSCQGGSENSSEAKNNKAFTIHSGVMFGMTKEEVIDLEQKSSFEFSASEGENDYIDASEDFLVCSNVVAAGEEGSDIIYVFEEGTVESCLYVADSYPVPDDNGNWVEYPIDNAAVLETLNEKYGKPVAEGKEYIDIGTSYDAIDAFETYRKTNDFDSPYASGETKLLDFYQWLVETDEGGVEISAISFVYKSFMGNIHHRVISYSSLSSVEWNSMIDEVQGVQDSLNNDL